MHVERESTIITEPTRLFSNDVSESKPRNGLIRQVLAFGSSDTPRWQETYVVKRLNPFRIGDNKPSRAQRSPKSQEVGSVTFGDFIPAIPFQYVVIPTGLYRNCGCCKDESR